MNRKILLFGILFLGTIFFLINNAFAKNSADGPFHLPGWPVVIDLQPYHDHIEHPIVGDLDGDNENDIIARYTGGDEISYIDAFRKDGTRLPGLPFSPLGVNGRFSIPAAADIDFDGVLDIVIAGGNIFSQDWKMYVFNYQNGQLVEKWSQDVRDGFPDFHCAPSIANIAGDKELEIVYSACGGGTKLFAWHANGSEVFTWPIQSELYHFGPPSLGDIDGDGLSEVFGHYADGAFSENNLLFAWYGDGTQVPGWPVLIKEGMNSITTTQIGDLNTREDDGVEIVQISQEGNVYVFGARGNLVRIFRPLPGVVAEGTAASLGDIDGDDDLEIFARVGNDIYGWSHEGAILEGWPQYIGGVIGAGHSSSVTIGNIAGTNQPEILYLAESDGGSGNKLYAFFADGTWVPGWPYYVNQASIGNNVHSSPTIIDLDLNGEPELVFTYFYLTISGGLPTGWATIDVLTMPGVAHAEKSLQWPTYQHDFQRTGFYSVL